MIRRKKVKLWDLDCIDPVASKASLGWGVGWGGGLFLQRVRLVQCPHSNPVAFSDMTQGHADKHRDSSKSGEWNIVLHWIFPFWLEWSLFLLLPETGSSFLIHFHRSWNGKTEVIALMVRSILQHPPSQRSVQTGMGAPFTPFLYGKSFTPLKQMIFSAGWHGRNNLDSADFFFLFCL